MSKLIKSLIEIQKVLKAPKSQYNSFGKYNYRSFEDILEAVKPLNAEKNLLLTLSDTPEVVGNYQYIKATATLTDGENTHTVTAYARESQTKKGMDESQITGTASSYARKYALNGLYLIDDTKDADSQEHAQTTSKQPNKAHSNNQQGQAANLITSQQKALLGEKVKQLSETMNKPQADVYKAAISELKINKTTNELTAAEASKVIGHLSTMK